MRTETTRSLFTECVDAVAAEKTISHGTARELADERRQFAHHSDVVTYVETGVLPTRYVDIMHLHGELFAGAPAPIFQATARYLRLRLTNQEVGPEVGWGSLHA